MATNKALAVVFLTLGMAGAMAQGVQAVGGQEKPKGRGAEPRFVLKAPSAEYLNTLRKARAANNDYFWTQVKGEAGYDDVKDFLAPLRYVNAPFRYPGVILSPKGSSEKMRFVESGFQLDANLTRRQPVAADAWTHGDTHLWVCVGPKDELFGLDEHRQGQPSYEQGYLPDVHVDYTAEGVTYSEEVFAGKLVADYRSPLLDEAGIAAYMRITPRDGDGIVSFELSAPEVGYGFPIVPAGFRNNQWTDAHNNAYAFFSPGGEFDRNGDIVRFRLRRGQSVYVIMPHDLQPAGTKATPGEAAFAQAKQQMLASWTHELAKGGGVEVPEKVVMDAWRSLLIGDWQLTIGDELPYGMFTWYQGNGYAESLQYIAPFIEYGFFDDARRFIQPILDYPLSDTGVGLHVCANRMELAALYYAFSGDAKFLRRNKGRLVEVADYFLKHRDPASGLVLDGYAYDMPDKRVLNLNTNSNGWRAVRDLALSLQDIGETGLAARYRKEAEAMGGAVRNAVLGNIDRSVSPPFVPFALGDEKPYGSIVESRQSSYYSLVMPYFFESEIFAPGSAPYTDTLEYMWNRQGVMAGLNRADQHSTLPYQDGIHPLYTWGREFNQISRHDTGRAIYTFYCALAHGYTRGTFLTGECQGTAPSETEWYRGTYLPPEPPANALLLRTLRHMLIHENDLNQDGEYDELWLLSSAPRVWLENGKTIRLRGMPTRFGPVDLAMHSRLNEGRVEGEIRFARTERGKNAILYVRVPPGYEVSGASIGGGPNVKPEAREGDAAFRLPIAQGTRKFSIAVRHKG